MHPSADVIRVLIVDDHALFRRGLRTVLEIEEGIEVVGEAGDGIEAVERAEATRPDVVVLDVGMPKIGGLQACRAIKQRVPSARVIMLTSSEDEGHLVDAVRAGASGYLLKGSTEEIALGIRGVVSGYSLLSPAMMGKLIPVAQSGSRGGDLAHPDPPVLPRLTDRQVEVLGCVARGLTNRQIAGVLGVSEYTVRQHVRNILDRFQMHSRTEAATYAVRRGLIDPAAL